MFKLRLMHGSHRVGPITEDGVVVKPGETLQRGSIFECEKDLSLLFPEKFVNITNGDNASSNPLESLSDDALQEELDRRKSAGQETPDGDKLTEELAEMTVAELKEYAGELEIVLPANLNKNQIIEKLKENLS